MVTLGNSLDTIHDTCDISDQATRKPGRSVSGLLCLNRRVTKVRLNPGHVSVNDVFIVHLHTAQVVAYVD